jgi:F-type H+-transporting ATPase subunit c
MDGIFYAQAAAFLGAAITMAFGSLGPALGQGMIGKEACKSIGQYPENAGSIRTAMIIALTVVESSAIYCLLIAGGLLFFGSRMG